MGERIDTIALSMVRTVGRWTKKRLLILTVLSVLVGIVVGLCVRQAHPGRVAVELLSLPGELFLRMLKMLILPLIMFSLMAGLGSLDTKVAGALGWRTVLYYMTTTLIAVVLGLTLVMVIQPGGRGKVDITPFSHFIPKSFNILCKSTSYTHLWKIAILPYNTSPYNYYTELLEGWTSLDSVMVLSH